MKIENVCLEIMDLLVEASLQTKSNKSSTLHIARIKIEKLKIFFRMIHELGIIETKKYIDFEYASQEISKDTNNWLNSLAPKQYHNSDKKTQETPLF